MKSVPVIAALIGAALALPAGADPRQPPSADYTADMVQKTEGAPDIASKLYVTKDRVRMDMAGEGKQTVIVDRGKKQVLILMPAAKLYQTMALPEGPDPFTPYAGAGVEAKKIGDERVGAVAATKWDVSGKTASGPVRATVWTTKENIQIKSQGETEDQGKKVKFSTELKNLKVGGVDPKVFEIPAGFKEAPKQ